MLYEPLGPGLPLALVVATQGDVRAQVVFPERLLRRCHSFDCKHIRLGLGAGLFPQQNSESLRPGHARLLLRIAPLWVSGRCDSCLQ